MCYVRLHVIGRERKREIQADRETNRHTVTDSLTDRQNILTDNLTDRQPYRGRDREIHTQTDRQTYRGRDRQTESLTDRHLRGIVGEIEGEKDRQKV
jgi:hypothetical protein